MPASISSEGFSRAAKAGLTTETRFRCRPCAPGSAAAARPRHFLLQISKRCRASLSRSSTNLIAASRSIGPLTTGLEFRRPFRRRNSGRCPRAPSAETERGHRAGTGLGVTTWASVGGGAQGFLDRRLIGRGLGLRLVHDAGDGRKRVVGRVALRSRFWSPDKRRRTRSPKLLPLPSNAAEFVSLCAHRR